MDTITGEIHQTTTEAERRAVEQMIAQGKPIVQVSETVARQQRAGQIALNRAERRTKRRTLNNRKKR